MRQGISLENYQVNPIGILQRIPSIIISVILIRIPSGVSSGMNIFYTCIYLEMILGILPRLLAKDLAFLRFGSPKISLSVCLKKFRLL